MLTTTCLTFDMSKEEVGTKIYLYPFFAHMQNAFMDNVFVTKSMVDIM